MVTKTVEVEEVQTVEEDVDFCNDCYREVDPDGVAYHPKSGTGEPWLHFCSECIEDMDSDFERDAERLSRKWWDEREWTVEGAARTTRERLDKANTVMAVAFIGVTIIGLIWSFISTMFALNGLGWMALAIISWIALFIGGAKQSNAIKHLKAANDDVFGED